VSWTGAVSLQGGLSSAVLDGCPGDFAIVVQVGSW